MSSAQSESKQKKVVNFFIRLFVLPSSVSSVMLFDGLCVEKKTPLSPLLYVFVMIAVCCQTHKNLNCSIKSPPPSSTPRREGMKALSARKHQTVLALLLIRRTEKRNRLTFLKVSCPFVARREARRKVEEMNF